VQIRVSGGFEKRTATIVLSQFVFAEDQALPFRPTLARDEVEAPGWNASVSHFLESVALSDEVTFMTMVA
jgi:hypothetical protein